MIGVTKWVCLAITALAVSSARPVRADDTAKDKEASDVKVEYLKNAPDGLKQIIDRTTTTVGGVYFYAPGTNTLVQSVAAGARFDVVVLLSRTDTANVEVTLTPFRLDTSGLGSGNLKVIPITVGSAADERYWATAPLSPVTIPAGSIGVRIRNVRVRANAKQPPDGDATKPFAPVQFPDHVIVFVKQGATVLAPTMRITRP